MTLEKTFGQAHLDRVYDLIHQSSRSPHEITRLILSYYPLEVRKIQYVNGIYNDDNYVGWSSYDKEMNEVYVTIGGNINIYDPMGTHLRCLPNVYNSEDGEMIQVHGDEIYFKDARTFKILNKKTGELLYTIKPKVKDIDEFYVTDTHLYVYQNDTMYSFDRADYIKRACSIKHTRTITTYTKTISKVIETYRLENQTLVLENTSTPEPEIEKQIETENDDIIVTKHDKKEVSTYTTLDQTINGIRICLKDDTLWCNEVGTIFQHPVRNHNRMTIVGDYIWCDCDSGDSEFQGVQIYHCEF